MGQVLARGRFSKGPLTKISFRQLVGSGEGVAQKRGHHRGTRTKERRLVHPQRFVINVSRSLFRTAPWSSLPL
jgi:hypothetical protein